MKHYYNKLNDMYFHSSKAVWFVNQRNKKCQKSRDAQHVK